MMNRKSVFITFEGGEGVGKSTQARHLAEKLKQFQIRCLLTREPGGSKGAEDIRKLLVRGATDKWTAVSETLLLFAARADHVAKTIKPALDEGIWVICDRFTDSTYAYQGAGRKMDRETIRRIEAIAVEDFKPNTTFILDLSAEVGLARTSTRATPLFDPTMKKPRSKEAQAAVRRRKEARFENFGKPFHQALREAFLEIARRSPERCVVIDASKSEDEVAENIWMEMKRRYRLN